jgi:hypothetical protein
LTHPARPTARIKNKMQNVLKVAGNGTAVSGIAKNAVERAAGAMIWIKKKLVWFLQFY